MQLHLVTHLGLERLPCDAGAQQLLLEGDWPGPRADDHYSLDTCATARLAWIDEHVDHLHAELIRRADSAVDRERPSLEYLLALEMRYYLVKLARFTVVVQELLDRAGIAGVKLWHRPGRDDDYVDLARQVCQLRHVPLELIDASVAQRTAEVPAAVQRSTACGENRGRRFASLLRTACAYAERAFTSPCLAANKPEIVLFGSAAHLGPLIGPLQSGAGARVHWLCETVPLRSYARWRRRGVRFCVCGEPPARPGSDECGIWPVLAERVSHELPFEAIDLGPAVCRWLHRQRERLGPQLARWHRRLQQHLSTIRPNWLVLDEDVTPLKRLAVTVGRQLGASSAVVQHGAPYVRYGFAPLAADLMFAWGGTSRRQFLRWGISGRRILSTGSPKHDRMCGTLRRSAASRRMRRVADRELLLFASLSHRDDRPDLISFQFTPATNAAMVRMALHALEKHPGYRLVIKLHPRTREPGFFTKIVKEFPELKGRVRIVRAGCNARLVRRAACVLSCASSAGIEAMLADVPVIHLMPAGSEDLLRPADWPFVGTARTQQQLEAFLERALAGNALPAAPELLRSVFANLDGAAARRIVAALEHFSNHRRTPGRLGAGEVFAADALDGRPRTVSAQGVPT